MSARRDLVAALRAGLPGWRITGYPRVPGDIHRPTVMCWQDRLTRSEQINLDRVRATLTIWVLTAKDHPEQVDDDLDDLLTEVLAVLQPLTWLMWTEAERGVLADTFPGYQITATAYYQIGE